MARLLRLPLLALACVALLAGFAVAFTSWWGGAGGAWDVAGLGRWLVLEGRRQQELEAHDRAVVRCLDGKYRVTGEVLAGRLTRDEAVEHFRRLEDARDEALGRAPRATGPEREEELVRGVRVWLEKRKGSDHRGTGKNNPERTREEGEGPAVLH